MPLNKKAVLLILLSLTAVGRLKADPVLTRPETVANKIIIYPDHKTPGLFYYVPTRLLLSQTFGQPNFFFYKYVYVKDQGLSDPRTTTGGVLTISVEFGDDTEILKKEKHGTVGCCALDVRGNLAAGTSTGGMDNKRYNRIGDSPVIGAGTYARNETCAVSSTGHGEFFIRYTVAHDISALMEYGGLTVAAAADSVVQGKLKRAGGKGGVIAVDHQGNIAMTFNTKAMFRAWAASRGSTGTAIFQSK